MNKLIICLLMSLAMSCESVSLKTDKVEVETGDKKITVEGVELKTEKTK